MWMSSLDNNATLKSDRLVFMTHSMHLFNLDRHRRFARAGNSSSHFRPTSYQFPHLTLTLGAPINWGYTCHCSAHEGHVEGLISAIWTVWKADKTRLSCAWYWPLVRREGGSMWAAAVEVQNAQTGWWSLLLLAPPAALQAQITPPTTAHPHSSPTDYNWPNV